MRIVGDFYGQTAHDFLEARGEAYIGATNALQRLEGELERLREENTQLRSLCLELEQALHEATQLRSAK